MRVYSNLAANRMATSQSLAGFFKVVLLTRAPTSISASSPPALAALLSDIGYQELVDSNYTVPAERPLVTISQSTTAGVTTVLIGTDIALPADVPPTYVAAVAFYWHGTDAAGTGATLNGVLNPWIMITDESFAQKVYPGSVLTTVTQSPGKQFWSYTLRGPVGGPFVADITSTGLIRTPGTIAWEPPRTQHVYLYPQKVNYVPDPSFEDVGLFGWRSNGVLTREIGGVDSALKAYGHVVGTRLEGVPSLITSRFATISAYVRSGTGGTSATWVQMGLSNWNASWTQVEDVRSERKLLANTWTRHYFVMLVPDNLAGSAALFVSDGTFDVDMVMVEQGADLNDYFDGDSKTGIDGDFSWHGVTHQSLSFWYNNRYLVGARLFGTYQNGLVEQNGLVYDWVPAGTSIYTHWDVLNQDDTGQPMVDFTSRLSPPVTLSLSGSPGTYVSTPDAAKFDITGDICLMAKVTPTNWMGAGALLSKWGTNPQSCYQLTLSAGAIALGWSTNGTTLLSRTSIPAYTGVATRWVAATLDVDNGAGGHDVKFWTSDDGLVWAQVGPTQTNTGVTNVFAGTADVEVGANRNGAFSLVPGLYQDARIYNGIGDHSVPGLGTLVGHFNAINPNATSTYTDELNNVWTINGVKAAATGLVFPGQVRNYLTTPDDNKFDFTGDWSAVINVVGGGLVANGFMVGKAAGSSLSVCDWLWGGNTTTTHQGYWVDTTPALHSVVASSAPVLSTHPWWGCVFDIDDGTAKSVFRVYWSDNGTTWTLASASTPASTTPLVIRNGTQPINVFGNAAGTAAIPGELRAMRIYNGIGAGTAPGQGTLVADVPITGNWAAGSVTDPQGSVWTLVGGPWSYVPAP